MRETRGDGLREWKEGGSRIVDSGQSITRSLPLTMYISI